MGSTQSTWGQYKVVVSTRDTQGYHLSQLKARFGFLRIWPKKDFKMVKVAFYCIALMAIGCHLALATDSSDSDNLPGELQPNLTPGMVDVQEGENEDVEVGLAGKCHITGNCHCPGMCKCKWVQKCKGGQSVADKAE